MGIGGQDADVDGPLQSDAQVGEFRVKRLIGEGAMSEVYLAQDLTLGRRVALKLIKRGVMQGDALVRFLDEARTTASFNHPHIVAIHGVGEHAGRPFLALEYLDGVTLRDRIAGGPASPMAAMRIARAVADAVAEAHRHGLVHADLKPENIFMPRDGRVRVLDFGLARTEGAAIRSGASGTPAYMAPERWSGAPMTGAADVWALGLILHELVLGRRPFADADLPRLVFDRRGIELPAVVRGQAWGAVVDACLALDPAARPTASEVSARLASLLDPAAAADLTRGPFPGLAPFSRADAVHYVGRQAELDALLEQLRDRGLVPITGPSGSGKSSFVHAALTPRLEEDARWLVVCCRPGGAAFANLAAALRGASDPSLADRLRDHPDSLALVLGEVARDGARVLLFIDQFEELFTLAPGEAGAFCACLGLAGRSEEPWRIVLTIRDDFLGKLAEPPAMRPHLGAVIPLAPMTAAELRAAVIGPLARVGYQPDTPDLPARIAADVVDQPAGLPLLQFACQALWQRRDATAQTILTQVYEAIGGASGALAAHAQQLIARLSPAQVRLARRILLALIHPDGTRRPRLRSELLEELPADAGDVLAQLLDGRLVISSRDVERDASMIELAHEALAGAWPQLAQWMDETHEQRLLVLDIERTALSWEHHGKPAGELWTGAALAEAVRKTTEWNLSLPTGARAFLDACIARDARARRRRRWTVGGSLGFLGGGAVIAMIAAFAFQRQREEALERQAQLAVAAADIGVFELALEPFDWDARGQRSMPPANQPALAWRLRQVSEAETDTEQDRPDIPGVQRGPAAWREGALVARVEAPSTSALLVIERGSCAPSQIFVQRLPGYASRHGMPVQLRVRVPTCQASAADMIAIPAGTYFKNANPPDESNTIDMHATLTAFSIDRTEVTRGAFSIYAAMESLTGDGHALGDSGPPSEDERSLPVVAVSFTTARRYCRYLGKDLPTVEQWQKAFRGGETIDGKPNEDPRRLTPWRRTTSPHPTNIGYTTDGDVAPVGSFPDDTSPYGVVDMAGNVSEWSLSHPVVKKYRELRSVLGGRWDSVPAHKWHELQRRNIRRERYLDFGIGMRCATPPSP